MNKLALLFVFVQSLVFANDPVITLNGDAVIEIYMGSTFVDPGATAYDEEDGDITNSIQVSGSVDTNTHGTYVLAYNVTDSDGNSATVVVRTINVVDNFNPSLALTITASFSGNDDVLDIGDTITYDIILSNTGNTNLVEFLPNVIALTDFNDNGVTLTTQPIFISSSYSDNGYSTPGEQHIYRATYLVEQDVYESGGLTLQLRGHGYWQFESIYIEELLELSFGTSSDEIILDGQISANNNQIKKVADPTDNLDAVNKRYVDQRTLEQTIPGQNIGDLLYWNGQSWQKLSAPQEQSTLRFCEGQLTWGPCKPQINIINAEFQTGYLYVYHTINSNNSVWDEIGFYVSPTDTTPDSDDFSTVYDYPWDLSGYNYLEFSIEPNTDYYIRAYISGDFGINYSDTVVVTSPSQDQNGNSINSKTYGNQIWSLESADVVTYRDGTPIPQVSDGTQWSNLTTGAWCYVNNSQSNEKLYNWYAVAGIHDNDPNTPNKEFAPEGWHVPTDAEWTELENYLIANGYNYDGTTEGNKIAKAMASTTGWPVNFYEGRPGYYQETNNSSGFNAFPNGYRNSSGGFTFVGSSSIFHSANSIDNNFSHNWRGIFSGEVGFVRQFNDENTSGDPSFYNPFKKRGRSVRFVKD